jgi:tetrahydromethanopterin S-methyltransferase subunit G
MNEKVAKLLQTRRYKGETWADVLDRVNRHGGVDIKILYKIIGLVLDEVTKDNEKETTSKRAK